ncbi:hypothetical protein [Kitasatospora aureofaciens]|nr:hypothetical protein [Kitasatospora aureofaciens]
MAYANGDAQQPQPQPEPRVVERGGGISIHWPQPAPQPPAEPTS